MNYEPVIGLEIHIELNTKSKMFCPCSAGYFGKEPNSHICPVCLGLPGSLPLPNGKAIEYVLLLGKALNCEFNNYSKFDRKSYFYPDLAKGYQISQYDLPFCHDGWLSLPGEQSEKKIGVRRAHLEEDTAKLIHTIVEGKKVSLIDFNRSGVPLVEIVSEPHIHSAKEAKIYAGKIQQIAQYLEVSLARIQEGEMRIEPNVSLRARGAGNALPKYKVEIKNIGSLSAVEQAIEFEIERQTSILSKGQGLPQETRGWDQTRKVTFVQRVKEEAQDYRYFPDPDIPPFNNVESFIQRKHLPELPDQKRQRFAASYQLNQQEAMVLTGDRRLADWFEEAVRVYKGDARNIVNWLLGEVFRHLNEKQLNIEETKLLPAQLAQLQHLIDKQTVSLFQAKSIFHKMVASGEDPLQIVDSLKMGQMSDEDQMLPLIEEVLAENSQAVNDYKAGKTASIGFLLGQMMIKTKGRVNPRLAREILEAKLKG